MNRLKIYLLLLCTLISTTFVYSSKIETLNVGYGANQYTAILQDSNGLMWLGCNRGLFFYDGYQAHPFQLGRYIYSIMQIDNDLLCFTDETGVHLLNTTTEQIVPTVLQQTDWGQVRSSLLRDSLIWFGSEKQGLVAYDYKNDRWQSVQKKMGECYALANSGDRLYVGSEKGLEYYDFHTNNYIPINLPTTTHSELVNSLLWDEERDCLWVGTIGSLFQYFPDKALFKKISVRPTGFKCMTFDVNRLLMIGTDDGLVEYNPETTHTSYREHDVRYPHSLTNNIIWSIYRDAGNNIWMGTDQGVSLMHYTPYYNYLPIVYLTTNSSLPTNEGNQFTCIIKDSEGNYWYGGTNGVILQQKNQEMFWFKKDRGRYSIPHNRIRRIYEDKENLIWLATDEGILLYNRSNQQFTPYNITDATGHYNAAWTYDLLEDQKGRLWIATYSGGLFVVDKQTLIASKRATFISPTIKEIATGASNIPNHVFYLIEDKRGNIWIGHRYGLSLVNVETMQVEDIPLLNDKKEIAPVSIDNMTLGEDGNLWYSVKEQLCKINLTTREVSKMSVSCLEDELIRTMKYRDGALWMVLINKTVVFDTRTGMCKQLRLPYNDYQALFYDKEKSEFIFGGNDGLLYVQPEISNATDTHYPAQIVSILTDNRRLKPGIDYDRKQDNQSGYDSFSPATAQLTFEISDYSYGGSNTLSYQYQLEGLDDKWTALAPGNNRIVFLNLNPGRYILNIRNGGDDATISSYHFEIRPPWYLTSWALVAYIILFTLLLILFINYLFEKNKKKYEQLEREKSLELSNMKIDFFTNMSHELKTPLSLIIAPLSKIVSEVGTSSVGQQLQMVHQNALRLNTLIQQILDFKRMEYKEQETLVRSRTDLRQLLSMVVASFEQAAENKQISIELTGYEQPVWMNIDLFKIESVIYNLLSNAIKFVPNHTGRIEVNILLNDDHDRVYIVVKDNGVGIAAEELKLIWLRLYQGGNKQLNPQGTGIGLYLVKRFVELHQGDVRIESEPGQGTTATIELPLSGDNQVSIVNDDPVQEIKSIIKAQSAQRPTLLIIDDNDELRSFLVSAFANSYQCLQAQNGKEGLDLALKQTPDIIIVDEMMPVMTGLEFCNQLRKATHMAATPIIMLTAKDDGTTELNSMKMGVDVFMAKPFDLNRVTLRIEQLLESRKQQQEKIQLDKMIDSTADVKDELLNDDERLMKQVLRVIEDNMSDSAFNVTQLCAETGIGSKRLLRMLKKKTGLSPVNFIRQIRLKKAAILLQQNKFTVSEVMFMVGFSHPSYFTKCFTEEFGVSPKEYSDAQIAIE